MRERRLELERGLLVLLESLFRFLEWDGLL